MHHHLMNSFAVALAFSVSSVIATEIASVSVFAQPLGKAEPIEDVEFYDVISKTPMHDLPFIDGLYHFQYPVDQAVSLLFKKEGYATSQSGVFVVPPEGFSGEENSITWSAIPDWLWDSTQYAIERHTSEKMKPGYCQLIATVNKRNLAQSEIHQLEKGAKVSLVSSDWAERRKPHGAVFYFGTLAGKPQPIPGMDEVGTEGGVVIMNIEPGHVYKITANKPGISFSTPYFACNPSAWAEVAPGEMMLINLSPSEGSPLQSGNGENHPASISELSLDTEA